MTQGCPDENAWNRLVEAQLDATERPSLEEHLDGCESCSELLAELVKSRPPRTGERVDRFVLGEQLGAGGMGLVFRAEDPKLQRTVALKLLRAGSAAGPSDGSAATTLPLGADHAERLLREARAAARLSHPNVIAVYEVGAHQGQIFVAMEWVKGGSLREWLSARPRSWREILGVSRDAARGLAAAHAAGLVHRDFKPENVLVGDDGRVRVADFGLARMALGGESGPRAAPGAALSLEAPAALTRTGAVLGTPAYMAPEQWEGRADARSDQFSFCVSLFEALFGRRPWAAAAGGGGAAGRPLQLELGKAGRNVPRELVEVIRRGLAMDPAERFPSMVELLRSLDRIGAERRLALPVAATTVATLLAIGGAAAYLRVEERRLQQCRSGELDAVWNPETSARMANAFAQLGSAAGPALFDKVSTELEAYGARWRDAKEQLCTAAPPQTPPEEHERYAQRTCLTQRISSVKALVEVIAEKVDPATAEKAVSVVRNLVSPASCLDPQALGLGMTPPRDDAERTRVEVIRAELAKVKTNLDFGRYDQGLSILSAQLEAARKSSYAPVIAEALILHGVGTANLANWQEAEKTFSEALLIAESSRHDVQAARAWVYLIFLRGKIQGDLAAGRDAARHAEAASKRIGGNAELDARRLSFEGDLFFVEGKLDPALAKYREALVIREKAFGPDHEYTMDSIGQLAELLGNMGQFEESLAMARRVLEAREKMFGPNHPDVGYSLQQTGMALVAMGRSAEAVALYERSVRIFEAALGPDKGQVAVPLTYLAIAQTNLGQHEAALGHHRRSHAIWVKEVGPEHPWTGTAEQAYGGTLRLAGRLEESERVLEHSRAIFERTPETELQLVRTLRELGETLIARGRPSKAVPQARKAVALAEKILGDSHPETAKARIALGRALVGTRAHSDAVAPLQRAIQVLERVPGATVDQGVAQFSLAKALGALGRDRERAMTLATDAERRLANGGPVAADELSALRRWLSEARR